MAGVTLHVPAFITYTGGMVQPVFRFAPSPNGHLHMGHAYSALLNEKMAREAGGRLLLRIEDIDVTRCRPHYVDAAIANLDWLGISFETPVRRQSEHMDDYRAAIARLHDMGLLYGCSCTRTSLTIANRQLVDPEGQPLYPQTCRFRGAKHGLPQALRLKMDVALARLKAPLFKREGDGDWIVDPSEWGDVVLVRKDIGTSYHLSVVVDDAIQGVTHVVRGQDMLAATSIHRLLQELLGLPHPTYFHHGLIMHDETRKLSKSHRDTSLTELRAAGVTATQVRQKLGFC
jgi:glutamyl-Q tRNA(Asp) synthetase